jgi:hypothetical protein
MNIVHPVEFVGLVDVASGTLRIGDLEIADVGSGFKNARVYVDRVSGENFDGFPVRCIYIEVLGDEFAQEWLDSKNADPDGWDDEDVDEG